MFNGFVSPAAASKPETAAAVAAQPQPAFTSRWFNL
jgi:hypothetical protein